MNQKRNIIISLQDKSDGEIKQIINNNTLNYVNYVNLAQIWHIHGELNIGNMIRSSHLCGCKKEENMIVEAV
jgi:hypothetical protein